MAAAATNLERARIVGDREIAINRIFDARRDLVFAAWIDPKAIGQWWGPSGFSTTAHSMEVQAGGHVEVHHAWTGRYGLSERGPL
jgi:uncharacterized protein YndB with AHSA1/START domain